MLMEGKRADDGRGAEVVIGDFRDLLPLVQRFNDCYQQQQGASEGELPAGFLPLPGSLTKTFKGVFWVRP